MRAEHSAKLGERELLTIATARANAPKFDWESYTPPKPEFVGLRMFSSDPGSAGCQPAVAEQLAGNSPFDAAGCRVGQAGSLCSPENRVGNANSAFIDWSPFFHTWELRGRYPAIFDDATIGKQARELFDDAQELLEKITDQACCKPAE